jgi:hypothetical protein
MASYLRPMAGNAQCADAFDHARRYAVEQARHCGSGHVVSEQALPDGQSIYLTFSDGSHALVKMLRPNELPSFQRNH